MSVYTIRDFYEENLPRGRVISNLRATWDNSSYTTLTVQPGTDEAYFIDYFTIRVDADAPFTMQANDEITITFNCYGSSPYDTFTIDDASTFIDLARYTDPELYEARAFSGTSYHIFKYQFRPPIYLRSSTSPSESIVFAYDDTGGGPTAGTLYIDVHGWKLADEDDSGLVIS